ncbi:MAG: ABC transporter permease [Lachnospiraceae bacterium]
MVTAEKKKENILIHNAFVKKVGTQKAIVLLIIIALFAFFSAASPAFRQYSTVLSIFDYSYYIAFMAIGVTFALITGGVDLSIGTGLVCYAITGGYLVVYKGWPVWLGMAITILFGLIVGIFNGMLVAIMDLPPFIATLCTMMITRGLGSLSSGGFGIPWPQAGTEGSWFRSIFKLQIGDTKYPLGFLLVILAVVIMSFVLNKTKVGRYIIAIGSNKEATRLSGVNVKKYQITAYAISGLFAGFAGLAYAATFTSINPGTGAGLELDAIGGAIVGGVSTKGGYGSVVGALLGVFVFSLLKTGLPYIGLQANWQQILTGLILVGAVLIDVIKNKTK